MNIFGEGFPSTIIKQIETRQQVLGYGFNNDGSYARTNQSIIYTNANSSWVKLVSATSVTDYTAIGNYNLSQLGYANGDQLAKDFILFNGTSQNKNYNNRAGINYLSGSYRDNAYNSWNIPSADFGFKPMPGIQSATIKHKNRGSIRTANVQIKAWDKISFEIIDILYLRLGFSVLLEWGNSVYFDNKSNTLIDNPDTSLAEEFIDAKFSYRAFLDKIQNKRLESCGNYDAMFAKVTNFHWSFNPDGSYDIILDLISVGDVIESFKIKGNTFISGSLSGSSNPLDLNAPSTQEVLKAYARTSDIADYLYNIVNIFNRGGSGWTTTNYSLRDINYSNTKDPSQYDYSKTGGTVDAVKIVNTSVFTQNVDYDETYFIRLGNLLEFIQNNIMYKVSNKAGKRTILYFDTSGADFMHAPDQLMSYDPSVCMVRRSVEFPSVINGGAKGIPNREYFSIAEETDRTVSAKDNKTNAEMFMQPGLDEVGKIMNIYVNFRFILFKLEELISKDGNEVKLIDFLKEILSGINGAMGGYPKLDIFLDETTNDIKIIDHNPLPSKKEALTIASSSYGIKVNNNYAFFELIGYTKRDKSPTTTSFIKDLKFNTELTPEFSTMITVAATNNGNVVGENNTALSKLNFGLEDKYKTSIDGGGQLLNSNDPDPQLKLREDWLTTAREYYGFISELNTYLNHLYAGIYINSEIENCKEALTVYFKLYKRYTKALDDYLSYNKTTNRKSRQIKFQPGTGFIPFNLSLTIDGLSGMKIGTKFIVDGSYLPSNYPEALDFLIKNIQHEIKDNKWITTLESYCISQGADVYKAPRELISSVAPTSPPPSSNTPVYTASPVILPDDPSPGPTPLLKQAVKLQTQWTYANNKPPSGRKWLCAGWTWNIAKKIKECIDKNSASSIKYSWYGAGDAEQASLRKALRDNGLYDEKYYGTILGKDMPAKIRSIDWKYGEIAIYYNSIKNTNGRHAQIFTGDIIPKSQTWQGKGWSGWTTDRLTNYGAVFVYSGRPDLQNIPFHFYRYSIKPAYLK